MKEYNRMGEQEFISVIIGAEKEVERLQTEARKLSMEIKDAIDGYARKHRKFKDNQVVNYIRENYRTPRRYIVRGVKFAVMERNNDGTRALKTYYEISTANGHKPNGGWSVEESELKLMEE